MHQSLTVPASSGFFSLLADIATQFFRVSRAYSKERKEKRWKKDNNNSEVSNVTGVTCHMSPAGPA
jgi:uncharacterized membrane protein YkgB